MPDRQPLVAIITGLPLEYEAMRSLLTDLRETRIDGTLSAELGVLPNSGWQVALVEAGLVSGVVHQLRPDVMLFVGIAGGLTGTVEIGDLVIATRTYAFQGGGQTPEGLYARPQAWHPSHRLEKAARSALRRVPGVHFGVVTACDVVLNDEHSPLLDQLKRSYNDAVAVEMEGAGVAHVAHLTGQLEMLTIRGISDVADAARKPEDPRRAQLLAANRAAWAAASVLLMLSPPPPRSPSAAYEGDHIEFRGNTFFGTNTGKIALESPHSESPNDN